MHDPFTFFSDWYAQARATESIADATAMTLATATPGGKPSARIVLLKAHGPEGFTFYTNLESRKSRELTVNPHAALCFYWAPLNRQIRIEGEVVHVDPQKADAYFASRSRDRQLGAWASLQSQPLPNRAALDQRLSEMETRFAGGDVPRPPHWSGWRLVPERMEFWNNGAARLHERHVYHRDAHGSWQHALLYP